MKKSVIILFSLLLFASTAFANTTVIEKFYSFSTRDEKTIEEINYYLSKGGEVKFLNTVLKESSSTIINAMVIKIPKDVLIKEPYKQSK